MKFKKKLSTLALAFTLLLTVAAPMATYAVSPCPHSPYSYEYSGPYSKTHASGSGGFCTITGTEYHKVVKCRVCNAIISDIVTLRTENHSEKH